MRTCDSQRWLAGSGPAELGLRSLCRCELARATSGSWRIRGFAPPTAQLTEPGLDHPPAEALAGYLLRLSYRLDLPISHLAVITGLTPPDRVVNLPAGLLLRLDPATAAVFAHATRLSTAEVAELTLAGQAARYPPLRLEFSGRTRQQNGIFVKETWVLGRSTRYCPDCLAGRADNPAEHAFGGAWNKLWRLPVVFACPTHQRLLAHTCPACHRPAHQRSRPHTNSLLPLPAHPALHPAACRNPLPADGPTQPGRRQRRRACAHRLDQPTDQTPPPGGLAHLLRLQQLLLNLLDPTNPTTPTSGGLPTTAAQYFLDLRILACLITASWPAARCHALHSDLADLLDDHTAGLTRQIRHVAATRAQNHPNLHHDKPPADPATCAALLALAARLLTAEDPRRLAQTVGPLTDAAPVTRRWAKRFLAGDGYCSPALHTALGAAVGAAHVLKKTGIQRRPTVAARRWPVHFSIRHIPGYLPDDWHQRHFSAFDHLTHPRRLRRAAVIRLAGHCAPGKTEQLAVLLGLGPAAANHAVHTVHRQLIAAGQRTAFDVAVQRLADTLDTATTRIDYGTRRAALLTWQISRADWDQLTADLPARQQLPQADWGDRKRLLATIWVWARITSGDPLFAPALLPHRGIPGRYQRGADNTRHYISERWPRIAAGRDGHYSQLRQRLDPYADQLATRIDSADAAFAVRRGTRPTSTMDISG